MLVPPVVQWSVPETVPLAAYGPPVAPAVSVFSDGSHWQAVTVSRARRQYPNSRGARMSAALTIIHGTGPTAAAQRPTVAPQVSTHLPRWPGTCPRCIVHGHGGIRVGRGRVVVSRVDRAGGVTSD